MLEDEETRAERQSDGKKQEPGGGGLSCTWTRLEEAAERAAYCRDGLEGSSPTSRRKNPSRRRQKLSRRLSGFKCYRGVSSRLAGRRRSCSADDITQPGRHF